MEHVSFDGLVHLKDHPSVSNMSTQSLVGLPDYDEHGHDIHLDTSRIIANPMQITIQMHPSAGIAQPPGLYDRPRQAVCVHDGLPQYSYVLTHGQTVSGHRIGWTYSSSPLAARLARLHPQLDSGPCLIRLESNTHDTLRIAHPSLLLLSEPRCSLPAECMAPIGEDPWYMVSKMVHRDPKTRLPHSPSTHPATPWHVTTIEPTQEGICPLVPMMGERSLYRKSSWQRVGSV